MIKIEFQMDLVDVSGCFFFSFWNCINCILIHCQVWCYSACCSGWCCSASLDFNIIQYVDFFFTIPLKIANRRHTRMETYGKIKQRQNKFYYIHNIANKIDQKKWAQVKPEQVLCKNGKWIELKKKTTTTPMNNSAVCIARRRLWWWESQAINERKTQYENKIRNCTRPRRAKKKERNETQAHSAK